MISDKLLKFYINGDWVTPLGTDRAGVENPATEDIIAEVALGSEADADRAILAARAAFDAYTLWPVAERIALVQRILDIYTARYEEFAQAMSLEMGAPIDWARGAQAWAGQVHIESTIQAAKEMQWDYARGSTRIVHEGIGVCALITPWNWPMNQIACKVAPALIAGCTMVLKPSEIAPLSGALFAEVCHAAGVPAGVFNLVNGTGPVVGARLSAHPEVDMVSFTGSTRAGTAVAAAAAPTVKRVAQELGGKSANIILPTADLAAAVTGGVEGCFGNSGQSCDAPTRMFVPRAAHAQALDVARAAAAAVVVGDPQAAGTTMGPLISKAQYDKVQGLIQSGIDEGATLVCGGTGRPAGLNRGWFAQPTIFGDVTHEMTISREEIFGPVLAILPYDTVEDAVRMANDTVYGLAAYVQGPLAEARAVGRRLRAGQVNLNYPDWDTFAPFGGYKQSGNGREYAGWGIHDFCETKALVGYGEA
ncbi:aldehyde dehydrogenase family protein [Gemmobacter fulvus]|uniref:Aldehyde dehydrogenase family protein n=1 Tax=Gemmobacter fulvus TaxID=2840474 RepID=A0A975P6S8_9RHOB|nr:aldehyde dehydrogenase family protein [Gemmobacter fulvus]MBT9245222.1 aldehyde dehydrogenase family protein [Gemmobacter fulvus]MDQ1848090.1 aldehyde dehydrogenase family protein [Gemmobacter fulvus]QWK90447.1 aldehyde dehydrogenase family protein [Gemmobacter fulvus]